jgi:hypothetical protein
VQAASAAHVQPVVLIVVPLKGALIIVTPSVRVEHVVVPSSPRAWRIMVPKVWRVAHNPAVAMRKQRMSQVQIEVELRPLNGGAYTELRLRGPVVSGVSPAHLRRLFSMLSFWSGWPVALALPVERVPASWVCYWQSALSAVPARHLVLHALVRKNRKAQSHEC